MPDLLGVTNHVPGYDKAVNNRIPTPDSQYKQLQNVPDLTKVSRADNRTEQQSNNLQGNGDIKYTSNFQTFLKRLGQSPSLVENLSILFSGKEGIQVLSGMKEGIALEMARILEMLKMDESQIKDFLLSQVKSNSIYGGALCALLRNAYANTDSEALKNAILQFLKSYGDNISSTHIEKNMMSNLMRMSDAIPARWAENLQKMMAELQKSFLAGDRSKTIDILQNKIFSYMAGYVEQTHDMGLPRQLLSMLALDIVRYENGSEENVLDNFNHLKSFSGLKNQMSMLNEEIMLKLLEQAKIKQDSSAIQFANALTSAASKALRGDGSQQIQQGFQNILAAMLMNESVYMPLNHYVLPLQWNGKMLFSELWVDPDAENENGKMSKNSEDNIRRILIKVDVQSLGLFDIVLTSQKENVNIQIACPEKVVEFKQQMEQAVSQILIRNELNPLQVSVYKMERPLALTDVFPKIFKGRNSVNVKA